MKSKKGFTLVELLAVIIVLIIILLIAISKIREASHKSHLNSIKASALSYKKVVMSKFSEMGAEEDDSIDSGIFYIKDLTDLGVKVDGKKPTGGFFVIEDSKVFYYCLEYENGYSVIENNSGEVKVYDHKCNLKTTEFNYKNTFQEFTANVGGYYLIELWGAEGGIYSGTAGKGAYTSGIIELNSGDSLYIYTGGTTTNRTGGYNGGANGGSTSDGTYYGGGGATDVRLEPGAWNETLSLASRIMVAAGGAGSGYYYVGGMNGGDAGALVGFSGTQNGRGAAHTVATGGTQVSGGLGVNGAKTVSGFGYASQQNTYGTGGGGGYYGGGSGGSTNNQVSAGAGGSSYISGYVGSVAITSSSNTSPKNNCNNKDLDKECSIHYSNKSFIAATMKAGNEQMPTHNGKSMMTGNTGNGYAKVTLLFKNNSSIQGSSTTATYAYTGSEKKYIAPQTGLYKLEAWGAQGGSKDDNHKGGYGAYSVGYINLEAGDELYINVGERGHSDSVDGDAAFTYNGGGRSGSSGGAGSGGGATSITLESGLLSTFEEKKNKIVMVAGAGGGFASYGCSTSLGGHGGGVSGTPTSEGGTQLAGGAGSSTGSFGAGGYNTNTGCSTPGAGSGYYGGGTNCNGCTGGGGSGYIGYSGLTNKVMYCYNCTESSEPSTKTITTTCVSEVPTENCAKIGSGYVKITLEDSSVVTDPFTTKFSGYNKLSYIASNKNQYIDSGVSASDIVGVYAKLSSNDINNDNIYFGSRASTDTRLWVGNVSNQIYFGWNNNTFTSSVSTDTPYSIKINYLNDRKEMLGETSYADSLSTLSSSNNRNIFIFCANNNGSASYHSSIKLYEFKISSGSTILRNYVPCQSKTDITKVGLCDLVSGQYFGSNTSSGFSAGSVIN